MARPSKDRASSRGRARTRPRTDQRGVAAIATGLATPSLAYAIGLDDWRRLAAIGITAGLTVVLIGPVATAAQDLRTSLHFSGEESKGSDLDATRRFEHRLGLWATVAAVGVLVVSVCFAAATGTDVSTFFRLTGSGVAVAAAAAVLGALLGFLFAIPRAAQPDTTTGGAKARYLANTNLEQISDWITKILVGLGLVQIGSSASALARLGNAIGPVLGDTRGSPEFGLTLCIFGAGMSFLLMYMWTRVRLVRELELAGRDVEAIAREVVAEVVAQGSSTDAVALSRVERQLTGKDPPSQTDLIESLRDASKATLVQLYQRSEDQRSRTWRAPESKQEHDRTIPVFRALIANDPELRFHRHFGSLGFALKDAEHSDLVAAIDALSTAIKIRGDTKHGFALYEWNRAACRILHTSAAPGFPVAGTENDSLIEVDLRVAASSLGRSLFAPPTDDDAAVAAVAEWLQAKGLDFAALF